MNDSIPQAEVQTLRLPDAGVVTAIIASGSNITERALTGSFEVVKSARGEVFRAAITSIDWLEALQQSAFKVMREVVQRLDGVSQETVESVQSVSMAVMWTIRGSSEAVTDVASRTAESLIGKRAVAPRAA